MKDIYDGTLICQSDTLEYLANNFNYKLSIVVHKDNLDHLNNLFQYQSALLRMNKSIIQLEFRYAKWDKLTEIKEYVETTR